MKLKRLILALILMGIMVMFTWLMLIDNSNKTYLFQDFGVDVPLKNQLLGIDVSHYQHNIDWQLVNDMRIGTDSISFVYVKLTEGTNLTDDKVERNTKILESQNIFFGYYHFFRPSLGAKKQADFFIAQTHLKKGTLLPVIDVELNEKLSNKRLNDSVLVFLNRVEKKIGKRPMIYTNESMYLNNFRKSFLKNEKFWIANYNGECESYTHDKQVLIWQFSDRGTINGISSKVDLNICKPDALEKIKVNND